jgi:drug/metabolite transporter (DMT)-like permease
MHYQKGILLVVISAVCYGFIPIFTLYAYQEGLETLDFLFYRYLVATIIFFLYMIVRRIKIRLKWKQVFWLFILGGVFNLLQSIFFVSAVKYISAGLTTLLFFIHPILVAVLSYFEGDKLSRGTAVAIFVSFGGLLLVLGTSLGKVNMLGVALSLAAAVFYTATPYKNHRVFLQVMPNPRYVSSNLMPISQAHPGHFPQCRVRLFGGCCIYPGTDTTLLWRVLQSWGIRFLCCNLTSLANHLIKCWHIGTSFSLTIQQYRPRHLPRELLISKL